MILLNNIERVLYFKNYYNINNKDVEIISNNSFAISKNILINHKDKFSKLIATPILQNQINKIVICDEEIALDILIAIKDISSIKEVKLKFNSIPNNEIVDALFVNQNLISICCYSIDKYFADSFVKRKNVVVKTYQNSKDDNFEPQEVSIKLLNDKVIDYLKNILVGYSSISKIKLYNADINMIRTIVDILKYNNYNNIDIHIISFISESYLDNKNIIKQSRYYVRKELNGSNISIVNNYMINKKNSDLFLKVIFMFASSIVTAVLLTVVYYYQEAMSKYDKDNLKEMYSSEEVKQNDQEQTNENSDQNYEELIEINSDTIGWLTVNNTSIDYPIVQSEDNDYYLNYNFYNEQNIYGWPFLDYRIDINNLSDNNIIYGHYSSKDVMFGALKDTLEPEWYMNPENQIITFNTLNNDMKFEIFSIYTLPVTNDYLISDFYSEETYNSFVDVITERSIYNFENKPVYGDKILTLSTCYNTNEYRLVIHAKLIN